MNNNLRLDTSLYSAEVNEALMRYTCLLLKLLPAYGVHPIVLCELSAFVESIKEGLIHEESISKNIGGEND